MNAPTKLSAGIKEFERTLVIPRQRDGVPRMVGNGRRISTARFSPKLTGTLIETEGCESGNVGAYWNENNTLLDTTKKTYQSPVISDFTVDGQWAFNPKGGEHRANGIHCKAAGPLIERLGLFNIPGVALTVDGPDYKGQAGRPGLHDEEQCCLSHIHVRYSLGGIVVNYGDAKLDNIYGVGIVGDGLTLNGAGSKLYTAHIYGTGPQGTAARFTASQIEAHNIYFEAAWRGLHLDGAHGCEIFGLSIGPACWHRGVLVEANGCNLRGVYGDVGKEKEDNPDLAGLELAPWSEGNVVQCRFKVNRNSKGIIVAGKRQTIDSGCWMPLANESGINVKVLPTTGTKVSIVGTCQNGTCLDLSESQLDKFDGLGNEFDLRVEQLGKGVLVRYPNDSPTYNLAPGNTLKINGVLQGADK